MDGSTIPYYVVEERKKLNRCIEEAPNDYEKEIYRKIRDMPVPYEKLNEILEKEEIINQFIANNYSYNANRGL